MKRPSTSATDPFAVYILECADTSLYIGCTNDLEKRLKEHNEGKRGAKYTKARRPVVLRYSEGFSMLAEARAREVELKRLKRSEKLKLFAI